VVITFDTRVRRNVTDEPNRSFEASFEANRDRLRGLARRMLASTADADDVLQEVWLRTERADVTAIANPAGWLTTVTARVCLNVLRSRATRREDSSDDLTSMAGADDDEPAHEAMLADSVGVAMLLVLETLAPAERVAFVLHDVFAMPFEDIAPIVERSIESTRQLASRARRRVHDVRAVRAVRPDPQPSRSRDLVDAFFAAARGGDLATLISVLHPDAVLHHDTPGGDRSSVHGAAPIARRAMMFALPHATLVPVRFGVDAGVVVEVDGHAVSLMVFATTIAAILTVETVTNADSLAELGLT
jgi:RNA polymerase sigma factor (sigma-70 family)